MYSEKVEKLLKENDIRIGDLVSVKTEKMAVEGELMPRPESGDTSILIIKLNNGYNIGISPKGAEMKKISRGSSEIKFPSAEVKANAALPKIGLIYTGGTIGSKVDYKTGGVYMLTKPEELLYEIPEISKIANVEVNNLMSVASEDLSYADWQAMANAVKEGIDRGVKGIVITHGTDTAHYTSAALSFMLKGISIPVVITGSQRSSDRGSSDAFINLTCAARVASAGSPKGVFICMHSSSSDDSCYLLNGVNARKMHTSRRDAFRPINRKPVACISPSGEIKLVAKTAAAKEQPGRLELKTGFDPLVAMVKAYPNSNPEIIDFYVQKGYHGIIIEGTGLGHTPVSPKNEKLSWLPHIKSAIKKGLVAGMTSQCIYGRVNPNVYRNLRLVSSAGVVYCEDMTPETAYVKLGWLLGNYKPEEAKRLLNQNIVGEIKERSLYDEFLI
jgi:glutamyl-tRNA(Gln) amidotransferase subunit D